MKSRLPGAPRPRRNRTLLALIVALCRLRSAMRFRGLLPVYASRPRCRMWSWMPKFTSQTANVPSTSLPKAREEATRPDLSETVRPNARISMATYLTYWGKTRITASRVPSTCVCDDVNKLRELHKVQPMHMIKEAMQKPSGKMASKPHPCNMELVGKIGEATDPNPRKKTW